MALRTDSWIVSGRAALAVVLALAAAVGIAVAGHWEQTHHRVPAPTAVTISYTDGSRQQQAPLRFGPMGARRIVTAINHLKSPPHVKNHCGAVRSSSYQLRVTTASDEFTVVDELGGCLGVTVVSARHGWQMNKWDERGSLTSLIRELTSGTDRR